MSPQKKIHPPTPEIKKILFAIPVGENGWLFWYNTSRSSLPARWSTVAVRLRHSHPVLRAMSPVKNGFALEERINVIQQKVSIISRFSTFVLARLEAQRSAMLELIIIVLILWGILLAILGKV